MRRKGKETMSAISNEVIEKLDDHIFKAGMKQRVRRGNAPEGKPRTWAEIEAYAEWVGSIRAREALVSLRNDLSLAE